jgi:ribose transport system permease protein
VKAALAFVRRHREIGPLAALVLVHVFFLAMRPDTFGRWANLVTMLRQTSVVGIAATGATAVVILGGIDLAVGSTIAITTVVVALLLRAGLGPFPAAALGVAAATACGLASGAATAGLAIPPFIATLGTMSILRGLAKGLAHEQKIDAEPRGLEALVLPSRGLLGVPLAVWLTIAVAAAFATTLRATRFGRHVVAIGSNERTARLCGIEITRVKLAVYALAGLVAGLSGVVEFATLTQGDPTDSVGRELDVIASVVIGGGSLAGGEGSVFGALLGALLMTEIRTGCSHLGLSNWVQEVVAGVIIIAAVSLDRLRRRTS